MRAAKLLTQACRRGGRDDFSPAAPSFGEIGETVITNRMGLPKPFVDAAGKTRPYKQNRYSVTEVIGGTCEAVLKRRHQGEVVQDAADLVWAIFGTAVHKVLEEASDGSREVAEKWVCVEVDGVEISGIPDLYDKGTGTVTDWKVTSVWSLMLGDYEKWRKQLLAYCWMLERKGEKARRGEIVAILRDHSMRKARFDAEYPQAPVAVVKFEFSDEDMEWFGEYLREWLAEAKMQEKLPDEMLQPCSKEDRWHRGECWAVMKRGKKAALRLLKTEGEAAALAESLGGEDNGLTVEHRVGEDAKCASYCRVSRFCPHCSGAMGRGCE